MKTLPVLLLLLGGVYGARAQGIAFAQSLAEARELAADAGKPVLLDAMTTWCAPCKQMDREVFSDARVAETVAEHFVPVKLNMEEGEGVGVAEEYAVAAYPTLLVMTAGGAELARNVGFLDREGFLEFLASVGTAPAPDSYAALQARYADGERDPELLRQLLDLSERAEFPQTPQYVADYLDATDGWDTDEGRALVLRYAELDNALFGELAARRAAYAEAEGDYFVESAIAQKLDVALFPGEGESVGKKEARGLIARAYPGDAGASDSTYYRFLMRRAREAGKAKRFGRYAVRSQARYPTDDPDELAELIYIFDERLPGRHADVVERWREREAELREAQGF